MRNLTQDDHNQGIFFAKLGHFHPIFEKELGRLPTSPPLCNLNKTASMYELLVDTRRGRVNTSNHLILIICHMSLLDMITFHHM